MTPLELIDEAFDCLSIRDFTPARHHLELAATLPGSDEPLVQGRLAQCRGTFAYHEGRTRTSRCSRSRPMKRLT